MERVLTRLLTRKVPFTFNRAGYYYFSRRVPADLMQHYSYPRIVQGLKTKSAHTAKTRALVAAAKLDEYWSHLRMTDPDLIGRNLLRQSFKSYSRDTKSDVVRLQALQWATAFHPARRWILCHQFSYVLPLPYAQEHKTYILVRHWFFAKSQSALHQ